MAREAFVYKEEDWVPQNAMGVANRSNVYTPILEYESGGRLITDERRYEAGQVSKNEYKKYKKEQQMAKVLANAGHLVEHLAETPRVSSYDVRIDGIPADLKRLKGASNIQKRADKAVYKQGARMVIFQFDEFGSNHISELNKIARLGIHGYYFVTGETKVRTF